MARISKIEKSLLTEEQKILRRKEQHKKYRDKNRDKRNEQKRKWDDANRDKIKQYYENNKEKQNASARSWSKNNRDSANARHREWAKNNPEKIKAKNKRNRESRLKRDPSYKVILNLRGRLNKEIKLAKNKKTRKVGRFVAGIEPFLLRSHLESKFKPGMSWENYGTLWCVDHALPISLACGSESAISVLNYYTNLQPLFINENLIKSDRIIPSFNSEDSIELYRYSNFM